MTDLSKFQGAKIQKFSRLFQLFMKKVLKEFNLFQSIGWIGFDPLYQAE
jgi:hypothetical protein